MEAASIIDWARALGFPVWAIVILLAWWSVRAELRAMSSEWRQYRIDMERRVTWLEALSHRKGTPPNGNGKAPKVDEQ